MKKKKTVKEVKMHKFLFAHANLKILHKVRKFVRGRTTVRPWLLETLRPRSLGYTGGWQIQQQQLQQILQLLQEQGENKKEEENENSCPGICLVLAGISVTGW